MRTISEEVVGYRDFLAERGNSNLVTKMYGLRLKSFLELTPEAMEMNEEALKAAINSYIDGLPVNCGKGVTSTAVRFYWSYRFGKPFYKRYHQGYYGHNPEIDAEIAAFSDYLCTVGIGTQSAHNSADAVRRFLYSMFHEKSFLRELVTVEVFRDYLSTTLSYYKPASKSGTTANIRRYAKFLSTVGYKNNANAILRLPIAAYQRHGGNLPCCISDENYRRLIESFDTSCERGARDRAMALCMGNLGLRGSDVAKLETKDIDWRESVLIVRHSKSISVRRIPLDAETGAALELYVTSFRPKNDGGPTFILTGGEQGSNGITRKHVSRAIFCAAKKAGIDDYHGTHTLRRSVATRMINDGVDIKVIADVLGHELITTTMRYLRVDLAKLRKVVALWPKEVRHA
jgi:site-specific recombinase XerD